MVFVYVLATAMQNDGKPPMAQGAPMAQAVPQNQNSMDPNQHMMNMQMQHNQQMMAMQMQNQ